MTTREARQRIRASGQNPNEINRRLQDYGTAGRLMQGENAKAERHFRTGHTFEMHFSCGHVRVVQVDPHNAGRQIVEGPCGNCQTFGVFR